MPDPGTAIGAESAPAGSMLDRVAVRVPPFWPEKPALWFAQLEGQFRLRGITQDDTKFWYVVSHLENRYALEVEDIITDPPSEGKYDRVKSELIRRLSASQEQRIRQLLEREEMGDRTPSQFLRQLRTTAGPALPNTFLKTLWLGRLPASMQAILATQGDEELEKIALLADKAHEVTPEHHIASLQDGPRIATLEKKIDDLAKQLAALTTDTRKPRRSRSRSLSRKRDPEERNKGLCWYHWRFGSKARKCSSPCSYSQENDQGPRL
ncbi:uncharacterized protein LOC124168383 [Ischnura elegans]|uniref:uncharacterized protein LOC124168383 n=1 Tax=Ischnura elegans TaxID=197161 RepID=UPI001ED87C0D|nr:uncharacterized protein LOC124168383 [Ischnura elegans]